MIEFAVATAIYYAVAVSEVCTRAVYLRAGEQAPCTGILAPEEMLRDCAECWEVEKTYQQELEHCTDLLTRDTQPDIACESNQSTFLDWFLPAVVGFGVGIVVGGVVVWVVH